MGSFKMSSPSFRNLPSYEELYPTDGTPPAYYDQTKKSVNEGYFNDHSNESESNPLENMIHDVSHIAQLFLSQRVIPFLEDVQANARTTQPIQNEIEVEVPEVIEEYHQQLQELQAEKKSIRRSIISESVSGNCSNQRSWSIDSCVDAIYFTDC